MSFNLYKNSLLYLLFCKFFKVNIVFEIYLIFIRFILINVDKVSYLGGG